MTENGQGQVDKATFNFIFHFSGVRQGLDHNNSTANNNSDLIITMKEVFKIVNHERRFFWLLYLVSQEIFLRPIFHQFI